MALRITLAFFAVWLSVAVYTAWSGTVLRPVLGPIPFNDPAGATYTTPVLPRDRYYVKFVVHWDEDLAQEFGTSDPRQQVREVGRVTISIRVTDETGQDVGAYTGSSRQWFRATHPRRTSALWGEHGERVTFQARAFGRYQVWASLEGDNQLLEQMPIELALRAQRHDGFYGVFWRAALVGSLAIYAFILFMLSIPYLGDRVCKWLGRDVDG
jgi:hypothetical protein